MTSAPLISIGIPVYNGERYLSCAIESVLNQDYSHFEICLSDNGSTDSSREIARDWAARDSRIRLEFHDTNRGAAWNFNRVARMARGDYFKWLAADDLMAPGYLSACLDLLQSDVSLVWAHSRFTRIDSSVSSYDESLQELSATSSLPVRSDMPSRCADRASERFRAVLLGDNWVNDNYGLIRSEALRRTRLELPFYGSEKVMLSELALLGRFAEVPQVLHYVREHDGKSASLRTALEQQKFTDSTSTAGAWGIRFGLWRGYWSAIKRHRIGWRDRCSCRWSLMLYTLQFRKWPRVLRQMVTGRAVKGAASFPAMIEMSNRGPAGGR